MSKRRLTAEDRAKVFKALADPRRVDIVDVLLKDGSLCGTELSNRLGVSLALLCHHWEVLLDARLLKKERVGQLRVCTLDVARLKEAMGSWDEDLPRSVEAAPAPKGTKRPSAAAKKAGTKSTKPRRAVGRAPKRTTS
jgi:DNA-binding transcriptional ArsR family regulator